jgi:2-polyprenyl-3-methyl-5-hydroxy-6-metoxy-1,4-benzoquinol methylase
MAEATSREECVDRHRAYPLDISGRLGGFQTDRVRRMIAPIVAGESVLDVGCNSGYLRSWLPPTCRVEGVDVAPALVELAAARLHRAQVAPAEELPYGDRAVDVIVLGEILEHVHDPIAVLVEARRVARRLIVGSTPHEGGKWGPRGSKPPALHRFHVRCFTADELRATLEAAGLRAIGIETIRDRHTPAVYVFRAAVP